MKRIRGLTFLWLVVVLIIWVDSASAALVTPQKVTASAIVIPAQVSRLGFLITAPVKEVAVKEGDAVIAGQTLVVLNAPELEYAVIAAEAAFRSAQARAEFQSAERVKVIKNSGRVVFENLPREVQLKAEAKAQQAQVALEIAQANLAQSILTAPYDGAVASIAVVPGELVQPAQVVVTLATLNTLQIQTTDLGERDIPFIKPGQNVSIYIEALDVNFNGKVARISPASTTVGGDVIYPVTIEFNEQPDGLLWGMSAEVEIQTAP